MAQATFGHVVTCTVRAAELVYSARTSTSGQCWRAQRRRRGRCMMRSSQDSPAVHSSLAYRSSNLLRDYRNLL
eukprot:1158942-Pelagomonas_calceolata.AAC.6